MPDAGRRARPFHTYDHRDGGEALTQHEAPQADQGTDDVWRGLLRATALAAAAGVTVLALVGGTVSARADVPVTPAPAEAAVDAPGPVTRS